MNGPRSPWPERVRAQERAVIFPACFDLAETLRRSSQPFSRQNAATAYRWALKRRAADALPLSVRDGYNR